MKHFLLFACIYTGDAYHITAPSEGGYGAYLAMKNALRDARLEPQDIHYINAHATSTPLGRALSLVFFIIIYCESNSNGQK